uniref:Uncharacterized protein n=1 Tax=Desulfacinum infernum TaxID=35837 RepID=A0A832A686_9BACT
MELFRGVAAFIGWLTGSVAGIAAIFYACGYLVARAHLNMLGLFGLFEFPKERYLQEGGKFFTVLASMLIVDMLPLLVLMLYLLTAIFFLFIVFVAACHVLPLQTFADRCRKLISIFKAFPKGKPWLWSLLLLVCLAYVLVFFVMDYYNDFAAVLGISNVLYHSSESLSELPNIARIERWLLEGDSPRLHAYFLHLLEGEFLALVVLTAAWYTTVPFHKVRLWVISPFLLIVTLYTLFTPMAYGVLVRPTKYAVVSFRWKEKVLDKESAVFYLLNKTDREVVVWDEASQKVSCLSSEAFESMQVVGLQALFRKQIQDP